MYDRILVPTDGSAGASVALEEALGMAERFDATVHSLYVVDVTASGGETGAAELLDSFQEIGENTTRAALDRAENAGVDATADVVHGTPHQTILEYVDDNDIDLIVMGTHGRTGLERYLLGSVTEKVVRTADVPVLTVRESENGMESE